MNPRSIYLQAVCSYLHPVPVVFVIELKGKGCSLCQNTDRRRYERDRATVLLRKYGNQSWMSPNVCFWSRSSGWLPVPPHGICNGLYRFFVHPVFPQRTAAFLRWLFGCQWISRFWSSGLTWSRWQERKQRPSQHGALHVHCVSHENIQRKHCPVSIWGLPVTHRATGDPRGDFIVC